MSTVRSLLPVLALALGAAACTEDTPAVCKEVRACCEAMDPVAAGPCQEAVDRALELDREAAEQHCESALGGFRLVGQCGGASDGAVLDSDAGTTPRDGSDASAPSMLPPSQGLSQPCEPSYGLDACGAALFCAAFDGRTIPTCYPEGVRRSGEACGEDRHCATQSCHAELRRCRAGSYQSCELALGCAESDEYCSAQATSCRTVGDGTEGAACGVDAHCGEGGQCRGETCRRPSQMTATCQTYEDCERGRSCVFHPGIGSRCLRTCDPFALGNPCGEGWDCWSFSDQQSGVCLALNCTPFTCSANETCAVTLDLAREEWLGCIPAGAVPPGGNCFDAACAPPGFCASSGGLQYRCQTPCDDEHPCPSGSCASEGWSDFGLCL